MKTKKTKKYKLGKIYKIIWRDIYVQTENELETVTEGLGKHCIHTSYGKIVAEDKIYIVVIQNDNEDKSDYIIIPKSVIIKYEELKS